MSTGMFNSEQEAHMRTLNATPPKDLCWCGWYRKGECHACPADKTSADKLASQCPECGADPGARNHHPTLHRNGCSRQGLPHTAATGTPQGDAQKSEGLTDAQYIADLEYEVNRLGDLLALAAQGAAPVDHEGKPLDMTTTGRRRINAAADALSEVMAFEKLSPDRAAKVDRTLSGLRAMQSLAPSLAPASAGDALAQVEAAGLKASVGHLSALLDIQTALLGRAMATMKALQKAATPADESKGDFAATVPYEEYAEFVDAHAALTGDIARSPIATPNDPSTGDAR